MVLHRVITLLYASAVAVFWALVCLASGWLRVEGGLGAQAILTATALAWAWAAMGGILDQAESIIHGAYRVLGRQYLRRDNVTPSVLAIVSPIAPLALAVGYLEQEHSARMGT